jgi:hypothetical protein
MNYFLSNLVRSKFLWLVIGLSFLAGLIIMDFLSLMLMGTAFFKLWPIKITAAAAVAGTVAYGIFLNRRENKAGRLEGLLPGFLKDRRAILEKKTQEDHEFQTLCHTCRHFDLGRLRCLLVLRERKAWIKLNDDSPIRYCLYWNLEEQHPVMKLTERLKLAEVESLSGDAGVEHPEDNEMKGI